MRRKQNNGDITLPSESAARREAFRDHNVSVSQTTSDSFERKNVYGQNSNLKSPNGEPSEIIKAADINNNNVEIQHHKNGHHFDDQGKNEFEFPHYQGKNGRHISDPPNN